MSVSYFEILKAVLLFAATNPGLFREVWAEIVEAYNASMKLVDKIRNSLPGGILPDDGALQLLTISDDELDHEERIAAIIQPEGTMALGMGGQLRKILNWAKTDPIGQALLKYLLSQVKFGS
jgi:hypothetical protein